MKWIEEFRGLIWTLAGTGLVLITLSGATKAVGLWISVIALATHVISMFFGNEE